LPIRVSRVPPETAPNLETGEPGPARPGVAPTLGQVNGPEAEAVMRLIDVAISGVLIGLIVGFMHMARPGDAKAGSDARSAERFAWLWMPVIRRPNPGN